MPTDEDWAVIRLLLVMALFAYFTVPWTWEMLVVAAVLILLLTSIME